MWKASSAAFLVAACGSSAQPTTAHALDRSLAAALATADEVKEPWRCAAGDAPSLAGEELPGGWTASAHGIARKAGDVQIGVIADTAGAAPVTLAALGRLRSQLDAAHVDLVLALGGMGETQADLEATLGVLADRATFPVVALAGDLEPESAQIAAISALRKRGAIVLDARSARWIDVPGAAIATLPGAGAGARLAPGPDGCAYSPDDLTALTAELTAKPGLRVLASAEAPRTGGSPALATGELALAADPNRPIDIHLHAPPAGEPSAARSGGRDGKAAALSPGSADATPRADAASGEAAHHASAGVLGLRAGVWTWTPLVDAPASRGR